MQKKLTTSGNSLAFVIDKSIAARLQIDHETQMTVIVDGRRLILEAPPPLPRPASEVGRPPSTRELWLLLRELDAYGMDNKDFARLSHDGDRLQLFCGKVATNAPVDPVTVKRLQALEERVKKKQRMAAAIDSVLAEIPDVKASA